MKDLSREERLKMMLILAEQTPSSEFIFNKLYYIVTRYDLPKHVDREFVYDSLIAYYSSGVKEDYGKCAELVKFKKNKNRRKELVFSFEDLDADDLDELKSMGYVVPDYITTQVLFNHI